MRKIFFGLLMLLAVMAGAQQRFNNEWIDYAKTYYKFKVGSNGVFRITPATLVLLGLSIYSAVVLARFHRLCSSAAAEARDNWRPARPVSVPRT